MRVINTILYKPRKLLPILRVIPPLPVLLVLGMGGADLIYAQQVLPAELLTGEVASSAALEGSALINDSNLRGLEPAESDEDAIGYVLIDRSSFLNPSTLATNITPTRNGLLSYQVKEGDTVSTIAAKFGISVSTIIWANNLTASGKIKPGQEIVILPVSGVLHKVKSGETLSSIAALYGVPPDKLATFNKEFLKSGEAVIVPNARPAGTTRLVTRSKEGESSSRLPATSSASGYLISPVGSGWNWGRLHDGNAVDISAACGSPIVAAAAGVVTETGSPTSWNSSYGGFVRISHSNGLGTFYAHTSANLVTAGEEVAQGSVIARVGRTGRVYGITGCHVHFGVSGAQNPFAR